MFEVPVPVPALTKSIICSGTSCVVHICSNISITNASSTVFPASRCGEPTFDRELLAPASILCRRPLVFGSLVAPHGGAGGHGWDWHCRSQGCLPLCICLSLAALASQSDLVSIFQAPCKFYLLEILGNLVLFPEHLSYCHLSISLHQASPGHGYMAGLCDF
jgi:hypothetical protein